MSYRVSTKLLKGKTHRRSLSTESANLTSVMENVYKMLNFPEDLLWFVGLLKRKNITMKHIDKSYFFIDSLKRRKSKHNIHKLRISIFQLIFFLKLDLHFMTSEKTNFWTNKRSCWYLHIWSICKDEFLLIWKHIIIISCLSISTPAILTSNFLVNNYLSVEVVVLINRLPIIN